MRLIAGAAALVVPLSGALAQPAGKVPVVGYLSAASRNEAFAQALRQGLADLGYVEGTHHRDRGALCERRRGPISRADR
jgi:hypothetical protein